MSSLEQNTAATMSDSSDNECEFILDDSDDEFCIMTAILSQPRAIAVCRQRINWAQHSSKLCAENNFERTYRMPLHSFNELLHLLRPSLSINEEMSWWRTDTGPISPEIILHYVIRWLAGGS